MKTLLTTLFILVSFFSWGQMKGTYNYNYAESKVWCNEKGDYETKDVSFTRSLFIFSQSEGIMYNEDIDILGEKMYYMSSDTRDGVSLHMYSVWPGCILIVEDKGRLISIFYELEGTIYQKCITISDFYLND